MKITFMQTGGTIDKDYPKVVNAYGFEITDPAVKEILEIAHPHFEFEIVTIMKKDSLDMDDSDRQKIKEACENADNDKIIITHGTDTMVETAKFLGNIKGKTIILTGSKKPERFMHSDASFNVGTAVGAIQELGEGVFIAMNGRIYTYDNCMEDKETGEFVECKVV
jgi:L-asparaginase